MGVGGMFLTHAVAKQQGKSPFFFSRFIFERMKKRGNTHYCFHCGGNVGFRPERTGRLIKRNDLSRPTNQIEDSGYNAMAKHDATHKSCVIGNASRYCYAWKWLECEIGKRKDFPFVVNIPSV